MRVCIVGASGKLGQYMVRHSLDRGYEVVGVCRKQSVAKLDPFKGRIAIIPGAMANETSLRATMPPKRTVISFTCSKADVGGETPPTATVVLEDSVRAIMGLKG